MSTGYVNSPDETNSRCSAFSLNWVIRPSWPKLVTEESSQLASRVGRYLALGEDRRALWVEARRDEHRVQVERPLAQVVRVVLDGDRVEVDDAEERLALFLRRRRTGGSRRCSCRACCPLSAGFRRRCASRRIVPGPARRRRTTRVSSMRIEPVPALQGHVAVPGDKSVSHRAVLIGAICEGDTRIAGFGRSADTESTIAAVRALGVTVDELDVDTLTVHGVGLRGLAGAGWADRLRERGHARPAPRRASSRDRTGGFELEGDESLSCATDGPDRDSVDADGRRRRDDERPRSRSASRARRCMPSTTSCRLRARRSSPAFSLRASLRTERDDRCRADPDARPHRAHARARGRPRHEAADERDGRAGRRAPAAFGVDVPGDISSAAPFLVGGRHRPGLVRHRPRRGPQSAARRPPRRARANGRAGRDLQPAL